MALYLGTEDKAVIDLVERKASVIGLLRVMRRTLRVAKGTPEGERLIRTCKNLINLSVEAFDTLTF